MPKGWSIWQGTLEWVHTWGPRVLKFFFNNIHLLHYYYNIITIIYYNMCGHDINISRSEVGVPLASLC